MPQNSNLQLEDLIDYEIYLNQDTSSLLNHKAAQAILFSDETEGKIARQSANKIYSFIKHQQNKAEKPTVGQHFQYLNNIFTWIILGLGLLTGYGTISVFLIYDGSIPINVIPIIVFFVIFQIVLLALIVGFDFLSLFLYSWISRYSSIIDIFISFIHGKVQRHIRKKYSPTVDFIPVKNALIRFDKLYRPLEITLVKKKLQTFAIAFHGAALLGLVYYGAFSDLAFSWSTTLNIEAVKLSEWVKLIAIPFSWWDVSLVPSLESIEYSQYIRLDGRYVGAIGQSRVLSSEATASWWPFLCCCIVFYGLLPRIIAFLYFHYKLTFQLRGLLFKDHKSLSLLVQLDHLANHWQDGNHHSDDSKTELTPNIYSSAQLVKRDDNPCLLITWLDVPFSHEKIANYLSNNFSFIVKRQCSSLGRQSDFVEIEHQLSQGDGNKIQTIIVVADAWELPGQATERLITFLQDLEIPNLRILFCPLIEKEHALQSVSKEDLELWRQTIQSFHNPYIGLVDDYGVIS